MTKGNSGSNDVFVAYKAKGSRGGSRLMAVCMCAPS